VQVENPTARRDVPGTAGADSWNPKAEAIRLWNADPCGGAVGDAPEGSRAFFAAVDRERYVAYAPWLPDVAGFNRFAGKRLLEVGCGMGTDLAGFGRGGANVFAVDLTPRHLRIARQRLQQESLPMRLGRADGELLPFRDGAFDVVYSFGVLHHTPGIEQAIAEIYRVLKPGGTFVIGLYHRGSVYWWFYTIFLRGIVKGGLLTKGYQRLVADIERHDHSDAVPLVRAYGRRQVRHMLKQFGSVSTEVHHLSPSDFSYLAPLLRALPAGVRTFLERRFGWYVFGKAVK
jgi:SAM-dependent methyltransferase